METTRTLPLETVGDSQIRWTAVIAGFVVGLASQMVLTLLGLAIGAWTVDLQEAEPAKGIPMGAGIWTGLSMLLSAFIGGYVTARLSGASLASDGLYHGSVVWGVTWLVFAWLTTTAMVTMIGGIFSAFGSGLQAIGQTAAQGVSAAASKVADKTDLSNVSSEGLRHQIESLLSATQKPELQPGELKKDAGNVTAQSQAGQPVSQVTDAGVAELRQKLMALDRDAAMNVLTTKFGLSEPQAREVVQSSIGMIDPLKQKAQDVKAQSVDMADRTIKNLATAALWLFLLAMLSLGATVGGAMLGVRQHHRTELGGRHELRHAHVGA
jgi:hypothetical protein